MPLAVALLAAAWAAPAATQDVQPEPVLRAHAHNDYLHARPLLDALRAGFNSIEVDVHLVDDELLVAHDSGEVDPARTLEDLYLAPLRERIKRNGGAVHHGAPPLLLLIDIKSDAEATYVRLHPLLRSYADILTIYVGDQVVEGPVVAVLSGNRPRSALLAAPVRFAAFDGRLPDMERGATLPPSFMPLVSESWESVSDWDGTGEAPVGLAEQVKGLAEQATGQGRRLRFWATPDTPGTWALLRDAGVHLINTDDLAGLRTFLLKDDR